MTSLTLVAIGFGVLLTVPKWRPHPTSVAESLAVLAGSFGTIGAGLFAPFHKKIFGAIVCGSLTITLVLLLIWI